MRVSIIVPIYNMESKLDKCLTSIMKQTYKNIEVILVLDGCTDNSFNICNRYKKNDSRIKLYEKKNGGVSSARNYGLQKATGEYIVFIDPDDWIEEKTIEMALNKCIECGADILQFSYNKFLEECNKIISENEFYDGFIEKEECILANISELYR